MADDPAHTFRYSDTTSAGIDWGYRVDASRFQDFNLTAISTSRVYYHNDPRKPDPYVDVSWWTASLSGGGVAWCDVFVPGSTYVCDHWHINFNQTYLDDATQDYVVCQEIAHSLGLDHSNVLPASCLASGNLAYKSGDLNAHDIGHIGTLYGP